MTPDLVNIGLSDEEAIEALQRAHRCLTRTETEALLSAQIGSEEDARIQADDALTAAVAQINTALLDCAKQNDLNHETETRAAADTAHENAIAAAVNAGAKNCLKITGSSQTVRDVDFVVSDNGITVSGTSSQASNAFLIGTFTPDRSGRYTVTSGLSGASPSGYYVQMRAGTSSSSPYVDRIYTEPVTVNLTAGTVYSLRFYFPSDITISDVCRPMIQPAAITDTAFIPYAPTNRELYEMILALQNPAAVQTAGAQTLSLSADRPAVMPDDPEVYADA